MSRRSSWNDGICWRRVKRTTFCLTIFVCACASQLLWSILSSNRVLVVSDVVPNASFLPESIQASLRSKNKSIDDEQSLAEGESVPDARAKPVAELGFLPNVPYGEFCDVRPLGEAQTWNRHKKVIAYSLFLDKPNEGPIPEWLWGGLVANVRARSLYYPDWVIRVFTYNLNSQQINNILELGVDHKFNGESGNIEVVRCHDDSRLNKLSNAWRMISRFLTIDDPTVAYTIVRDLDSQFSPRELLATNEWISSGLGFHTMRDHQYHIIPVMGGMFGMKRGVLGETTMTALVQRALEKYPNRIPGCCADDQNFLTAFVWPVVKSEALDHDGISVHRCQSYGSKVCRPFPLGPRSEDFFIGRPFKEGTQNTHWDCELQCKEASDAMDPIVPADKRTISRKPLSESIRSKRLYVCGFPGDYQQILFPEHTLSPLPQDPDLLLQDAAASEDVLILNGDGYKPVCAESWSRDADFAQFRSKFPGKILVTNGESTGISAAPETQQNVYRLGNYKPNSRSMRVTFCQLTLLAYGPAAWKAITEPALKPRGTKERFAIYAASNCKSFRQEAARRLTDIGVVEVGGRCPITDAESERVQLASDLVRKADWSQNYKRFVPYRFCLAMENEYVDGYVTEKILNAFLAGCIPIYYGSRQDVLAMFNEKAFVFYDINDPEPAVARIQELESNPEAYEAVMAQPILANGTQTVAEYFSFTKDIGDGQLVRRIHAMMGLESNERERDNSGSKTKSALFQDKEVSINGIGESSASRTVTGSNQPSDEQVTAIIATCNREKPLNDAILSILGQTKPVHEVVVVIGGDDSCFRSIANIWGDKVRILKLDKCHSSSKCGEAGRARQYAIYHANPRATHFAFLDDDDVWLPHKMEVQLKTMKQDGVGIISSDALVSKENGAAGRCREGLYTPWNVSSARNSTLFKPMNLDYQGVGNMLASKFGGGIPKNITLAELEIHNLFVTSSVVVSKAGLGSERFDSTARNGQETYGLWKRVLMRTPGTLIHDQLIIYDVDHGKEC